MNEAKSCCQRLSGSTLKWIACISMLIDHTAFLLIGCGVLNTISPDTPAFHMWLKLYFTMRCIGRIAFPIYVFLLTEGIVHTSNWKRYAIRLGVFAVLSELPFDWMMHTQQSSVWEDQNVFFTLLIGLITIKSAEFICSKADKTDERLQLFFWLAATAAGCITAELMNTDYSYIGVILAVLLYLYRKDRQKQCIFGFLWKLCHVGRTSYILGTAAAFLLIYAYNGQKGSSAGKYLFYGFYPAQILLVSLLYLILFAGSFLQT